MRLVDGKAAKIFERLWQWRGQWIPAKWLMGYKPQKVGAK